MRRWVNRALFRFCVGYRLRRRHIYTNSWALCIGILSTLTAITFFLNPQDFLDETSVGQLFKGSLVPYIWNVFYGVGGALIAYGILRPNDAVDILGLYFLTGALLINAFAIIILRGVGGLAQAVPLIAFGIAAMMRVRVLTGKVN